MEIKEKHKKFKEKYGKLFSFILTASRLVVFAALMYVTMVLYKIGMPTEAAVVMFAAALFILLNAIDGR